MADKTNIEWSEATWNPITGCSLASPGCTNCYAMRLAGTRMKNHHSRAGLTEKVNGNHVWTGEVRLNEQWVEQPLRWTKPRMIFVCAHGDLFHESVPVEWIDRVFAIMALCPQHTFQLLTKRSARMRDYVNRLVCESERWERLGDAAARHIGNAGYELAGECAWPLPNVWVGVSAEDQVRADQRLPQLEATPAAVRWISFEPLLSEIDYDLSPFDWAVVGGESGSKARPMHPDAARIIRELCREAEIPFFFKQWGEWLPWEFADEPFLRSQAGHYEDAHRLPDAEEDPKWGQDWLNDEFEGHCLFEKVGKKQSGRLLDGVEHNEMPNA